MSTDHTLPLTKPDVPHSGINIAVMTSGGDAQGMNAAIRAVVRRAAVMGAQVWAIFEGYVGMVAGGEQIHPLGWDDVAGLLPRGGTIIGTSRSAEFRTTEGRRKACLNLVMRGIDRLVCIGGDGSLTGANLLSTEWKDHLKALVEQKLISEEQAKLHSHFVVVGIVGSIDNDFCGTDMTIGADSALHRIVDAVDALTTTASSHQRSFVVEVMGRNCGYLAAMAAVAVGADYAFIPESPTIDDWRDKMCRAIKRGRDRGRRHSIVVVSEGAKDYNGAHISAEDVKNCVEKTLGFETRVTTLGHVQRGGSPSNYDRLIATMMGIEAVNAVVEATENTESMVIGIRGGKMVRNSLVESVQITQSVAKAIDAKDYAKALYLRGTEFARSWATFLALSRTTERPTENGNFAMMTVGAPSPGMNSAARALTRLSIDAGYNMFGIFESTRGLCEGDFKPLSWIDVDSWCNLGGAVLGTNRESPEKNLSQCAERLVSMEAKALFIIGGWEAYTTAQIFSKAAEQYPAFRIPIVCIPATISNNCPGTYASIGADTALNTIVESSDRLKLSAVASRCRVFVMEVHGGRCGYLATASTLSGGGHITYTPEKGITLQRLCDDIEGLKKRFKTCKTMALVIVTECANPTYTTEFIEKLMIEEAHDLFDVRKLILGHIQQGNYPSPLDRVLACDLAHMAVFTVTEAIKNATPVCGGVGTSPDGLIFTPLNELVANMDFKNRRPIKQTWDPLLDCIESLRRTAAIPTPCKVDQPIRKL